MIDNGSPDPEFHTDDDRTHFLTVFRANMDAYEDDTETSEITESGSAMPDLNERQKKAIEYVKEHGKITNKVYQKLNNTTRITATRDLVKLVELKVFKSSEIKGAGSFFELHH